VNTGRRRGLAPARAGLTKRRGGRTVDASQSRRVTTIVARSARQTGSPLVARRSFATADALIVVSTDGYFDVYPPTERPANDKPKYRGALAELGPTVRGSDDRLSVRPESAALDAAVSVWSRSHGAAAVRGDMGGGRDGKVTV
jgi:hypothetical protein